MQFEGLDQNAIKMAILTITDSAGISSSIVEEGEDWYVTLDSSSSTYLKTVKRLA